MNTPVSGKEGVLGYINSVGGVSGSSGGSRASASGGNSSDWILALSRAWGDTMDNKANEIIELSSQLGQGNDSPSQTALLTAASQQMAYLAQSAATSVNAASEAVSTIARKQ